MIETRCGCAKTLTYEEARKVLNDLRTRSKEKHTMKKSDLYTCHVTIRYMINALGYVIKPMVIDDFRPGVDEIRVDKETGALCMSLKDEERWINSRAWVDVKIEENYKKEEE